MSHDASLEPVLRRVEPAVRLVSERHFRQVLHHLIDWGQPLPTNTELTLRLARADLSAAPVLPPHVTVGEEPELLLITDPNDRMIERLPHADQLRVYWEVLYGAAIEGEIRRKLDSGELTPGECRDQLNRFGSAVAREVRYVLQSEHLFSEDADDAMLYQAFAAAYLRTEGFSRYRLECLFPMLPHGSVVRASFAEVLDPQELLARTRPEGASEPYREPEPDERWEATDTVKLDQSSTGEDPRGLIRKAAEAEQKGNSVRAAILRTQAVAMATGSDRDLAEIESRKSLGDLVNSLGDMFAWDADTRLEWRQALAPLLEPAAAGFWPRAARCLYDLQKLPADLSREVYAADLSEWLRTLGRRPVKRPLPRARPVRILIGLRKAHTQMLKVGLGHSAQLRLDRLFHHQVHLLEHNLRTELTPVISHALTDAGLTPQNPVEEVGRDKLVAELLDRVCERGYLRIGDLRDAIARNRLKMADMSSPGEFIRGDSLLRADTNLAYAIDGVYRRGEFYLRWLQRASSLFFANPVGRALFLYLLLPFGGAFMTVVFAQEMTHLVGKAYHAVAGLVSGVATASKPAPEGWFVTDETTGELHWTEKPPEAGFHVDWEWVVGLAIILFCLLHVPSIRSGMREAASRVWWVVRGVLWDLPRAVWKSPAVRVFRQSRPVQFLHRHFWSPFLVTIIVFVGLLLFRANPFFLLNWGWLIWAVLTIGYNTPWGWGLQDQIAEAVSDWWRVVRVNLIPGIIATIIDWFRALANWFERQLYAVDEKLRFRGGDSQRSFILKVIAGLIWFPIAYVTRFAFYLLIEPQINPVKHFPVVTVSHKLLLPLVVSENPASVPSVLGEVMANVSGWGVGKANFWAFWIVAGIPGVFGFVAWELLSNWRLYRANRSDRLRPVTIGSHGETMRGLLRPGFHSGTVPKLFRKMRQADRYKINRLHHELEHCREGVQRFLEREFLGILERSGEPLLSGGLRVGEIRFGCQRLTAEILAPSLGNDAFVIGFENVSGRIAATVEQNGWADRLTSSQQSAFYAALRGLLDMAASEEVNARSRSPDGVAGIGKDDLAREVSWAEWVERWNAKRVTPPGVLEPSATS